MKRIALVSDFFYPNVGGVEIHIWALATNLHRLGHKVIIITHAYSPSNTTTKKASHVLNGRRSGVRYLPGPIKVYYCPFATIPGIQDTVPTFLVSFPLIRCILIRERIEIVHGHQATSTLASECIVYAAELGISSVYTDHSLFGFNDVASLTLNKVLKTSLSNVGAAICVSNVCKENLILRASLDASNVFVIPNAVDTVKFTPDPSRRSNERITIVAISRLVYRKGVDLLIGIIPEICHQHPNVDFLIGGDGNKRRDIEDMINKEHLERRVTMLGALSHGDVRDALVRGHFFLNCSLTESFCIAILEAASCGLYVVSTDVGGVSEVLPSPDMCLLAPPNVPAMSASLSKAISRMKNYDSLASHDRVGKMYSWELVAARTVSVYERVLRLPRKSFLERLSAYRTVGAYAGVVACCVSLILRFWIMFIELCQPVGCIDVVPDIPNSFATRKEEKSDKAQN